MALATTMLLVSSCYEDYVKDYDYDTIYFPYQFDLRTFIAGEGMSFNVGTQLAGVIENNKDRNVKFTLDNMLLTDDLSDLLGAESSVSAYQILSGASSAGKVSQAYVTTDIKAAKMKGIAALNEEYFTLSDKSEMVIKKGAHSGTITVKADSAAICADSKAWKPYYALGFRITDADAKEVIKQKSFLVLVVRVENMLFGNYLHGGVTSKVGDGGQVIESQVYATAVNQTDDQICRLTSSSPYDLTTNKIGPMSGALNLHLNSDNTITVSDATGSLDIKSYGSGSWFNNAKLLQDRKIFLNYEYDNGDGTSTIVCDTLSFRNRVEDGVNVWRDLNSEHYE